MRLFLIRHAPAEPRDGSDDAARPLTKKGKKQWKRAARGLERLDVRFDALLHSPLRRAVETAEQIAHLCDGRIAISARLAEPPSIELFPELAGERVALVGPEPWLSELAAILVLGAAAQGPRFDLKKGSVLRLDGELRPGGMRISSLATMKTLAALDR